MHEFGYGITSPQKWNYKMQKKLNLYIHICEHIEEHVKRKISDIHIRLNSISSYLNNNKGNYAGAK